MSLSLPPSWRDPGAPLELTETQIIYRRMQQRRCIQCGAAAIPQRFFCAMCWQAGRRFCTRCERIYQQPPERHDRRNRKCIACTRAEGAGGRRRRGAVQRATIDAQKRARFTRVVRMLARMWAKGFTRTDMARDLGVTPSVIHGIIRRARAASLWTDKGRSIRPRTEHDVRAARYAERAAAGWSYARIAQEDGTTRDAVGSLIRRARKKGESL